VHYFQYCFEKTIGLWCSDLACVHRWQKKEDDMRAGYLGISLLFFLLFPQEGYSASCEQEASALKRQERNKSLTVLRKTLFRWHRLLKRCDQARYAAAAARCAEKAQAWDQAINLWSKAIRQEKDKEKRDEYETERKNAQDKFSEIASLSLKKRQKKAYWDGARADLVMKEEPPSIDVKIVFAYNSDKLLPEGESLLESIVAVLRPLLKQGKTIKIVGHADSSGGKRRNLRLSELRARAVSAYLKRKGLSTRQLPTEGIGSSKPFASNKTPEGRSRNRRVEFVLVGE
jgi:outer membrane protein OmpA-like peptidoglycan-associated protein